MSIRMKAIILIGAPGAGKGTAAEALRERTAYRHVSTGDMLREAVKAGSPVGIEARQFMERGALVPDSIILKLVRERLLREGAGAQFMFDGFPRTVDQAAALDRLVEELKGRISAVFSLACPDEMIIRRIAGRRVCRKCAAVFNVNTMPSRVPGVCDKCGGELWQRPDDTEATVRTRLEVFLRESAPLMDYYRRHGLVFDIDARDRETMLAQILSALKDR